MENFKFSTLEYKRPDLEAQRAKLGEWKNAAEQAQSYEALRALPEGMRYAVVLVYLDGCTMRECAKMLRVPEGTVKSRLSRAKALLRDYLSEEA